MTHSHKLDGGLRILAINASPRGTGRTTVAVLEMLAGAKLLGAAVEIVDLDSRDHFEPVVALMQRSDGVVLASPTYRARPPAQLKAFLDALPRTSDSSGGGSPFAGKAVALLQTGATAHHFLATEDTRAVLSSFFAAQVMAPSLYFSHTDYEDATKLTVAAQELAQRHGRALAQFSMALKTCPEVTSLQPLA
ncbi:NAD(P)H-dependent oxidoreductase [Aeromicrobium ginsengisoli]|nr:NAD(P)H-dependent oxidoreductase [Aeromicrobium ginsengisoli]